MPEVKACDHEVVGHFEIRLGLPSGGADHPPAESALQCQL